MRTRSGKGSDGGSGSGSGSETDARASSRKGGSGGGKVRRHNDDHKSLVRTAWTLVKQVFFTIVHIYKSLTAFWSQMNVCMLPALGELDHEEQQEQDKAEQELNEGASGPVAGSPQRKRTSKVN